MYDHHVCITLKSHYSPKILSTSVGAQGSACTSFSGKVLEGGAPIYKRGAPTLAVVHHPAVNVL